jgi:hypothetical protein
VSELIDGKAMVMDESIRAALESDSLIDITTTGRRTGQRRRIEVGFSYLEGRFFITGRPGRRGWYANLIARPHLRVHFKQSLKRDVWATGVPILDREYRRRIFEQIREGAREGRSVDVDEWVVRSPLVLVEIGAGSPGQTFESPIG